MADITAISLSECLGWRLSDDKRTAIIGFKQPSEKEIALAVDQATLMGMISALAASMAAFNSPKGGGERLVLSTDWFEIGPMPESKSLALSFRLVNGGWLSFQLDPVMAENLLQILGGILHPGTTPRSPRSGGN